MRRLSAILLLCVFAWSQYVKQVIYLECRLSNTFKSFAIKCDCEKTAGLEKQKTGSLPLPTTHSHTHLDELFPAAKAIVTDFSYETEPSSTTDSVTDNECDGCQTTPFHPPRLV